MSKFSKTGSHAIVKILTKSLFGSFGAQFKKFSGELSTHLKVTSEEDSLNNPIHTPTAASFSCDDISAKMYTKHNMCYELRATNCSD